MGGTTSKSPLERRNTVARRSQRRTLHNLKPKIDNVYKDIKKFKGTTEDANFVALKNEIEYLKADLSRRGKDLQPQVRNLYENIYKRICEAEEELNQKLNENQEKNGKKEAKQRDKEDKTDSNGSVLSEDPDRFEVMSDISTAYPGSFIEETDAKNLEQSKEKRRTVELKVVKVVPEEEIPVSPKEVNFRTPEEKRKSILKTGVAVMPGAILNEMFSSSKKLLKHSESSNSKVQFEVTREMNYESKNDVQHQVQYTTQNEVQFDAIEGPQEVSRRINEIIQDLQETEMKISEFVGKKNGKLYTKINDGLNNLLMELKNLKPQDEDNVDQRNSAIKYVNSCLSFLDERATDDTKKNSVDDDEVFLNNNVPMAKRQPSVEDILKLQSLLKNTPV